MASNLFNNGHVTHNWQEMAFLQEVFDKEDHIRAESDECYRDGRSATGRRNILSWDTFGSARSGRTTRRRNDHPASTSRSSLSSCSCSSFGSSASKLSGRSTFRSQDSWSTGRLRLTGRSQDTMSTEMLETLKARKQKLQSRLKKLEEEIEVFDHETQRNHESKE